MYTIVHSDVFRESYSFEFFDLPLNVPLVWEINWEYMAYVSLWIPFDLSCKSITLKSEQTKNLKKE